MEVLLLGMLQTPEIIMILVLALILFGAKKLPELAKGLGNGIKEFRKASREISEELNSSVTEERPPSARHRAPDPIPTAPEGVESQSHYDYAGESAVESAVESSGESTSQPSSAEVVEPPVSKA
jgi:sec-independent protein translocase protein TatA